ncbi:cytochrome c oxidase assembly protein COX16 homolog l(3)neo43 isoform X2 [Ptiloglossa arizonensis]|uniref:cytochrome c oxidase assembly protein COX16 homolog l(3)neo43 isoform X2 n=1 Tax=Ptiloglossa arizonensis TaxID=3350558 RepID=UPI003F9F3A79
MLAFYTKKGFKNFVPFIILVIGGSFLLREFIQVKLKYKTVTQYNLKEDMEKHGIKVKKSLTLEEEYEKLKESNLDNWENVRIPRPWDEEEEIKK